MSADGRRSGNHGCGADAAAYALGALDQTESEAFREHVASCAVCLDELSAFRRVLDELGAAVPRQPAPRRLRRQVLSAARAQPPGAPGSAPSRPRRPARGRIPVVGRRVLAGALAAALVAGAVAALVAGALALLQARANTARVADVRVTRPGGKAQLRVTGDRAVLLMRDLPAPGPGRIYELWLTRGGRPPSATGTLFGVTSTGTADIGVPGSVRGVTELLVTSERAGGALAPTGPPVILARLT